MRDFDPTASEFISSGYIKDSHPGGLLFDPVSAISAGSSLIGGIMGADSASDAANIQAGASREATAEQRRQYDLIRKDLEGYRTTGGQANDRLAQLLGLGNSTSSSYSGPQQTAEQIRAELLSQYTKGGLDPRILENLGPNLQYIFSGATGGEVDEAGLQAAINSRLAQQSQTGDGSPIEGFGSLLKEFTGDDLQNDPGYQFGLNQGMQAQDNSAARAGSLFSGAALKASQRYGQDYAGTKFNEAFNRDSANKAQQYNFLTGMSNTGLNAATQTGIAGSNMANQVGANITSNANAQGAAAIASGNAWSNAIQSGIGNYQNDQLLQKLTTGNTGYGTTGLNNFFFGNGTSGD